MDYVLVFNENLWLSENVNASWNASLRDDRFLIKDGMELYNLFFSMKKMVRVFHFSWKIRETLPNILLLPKRIYSK